MTNLALDTELNTDQRKYLNMAKFSADSLLKVINDILDFSKVEAGKLDLELITFDLRKSIADTTGSLKVRAEEKGIELSYDISSDVPDAVAGDPARLNQVVVNLVGNAIKFTEAGNVTVGVSVDSLTEMYATIHIEVSDTGAMEGDRERCLSAGKDAYLSKPVQPDQISGVIAQLLGEGSTVKPPEAVDAGFFDMNELLKRVGGDMGLLEEVYRLFLEDYPKMLQDTFQAIEA